MVFNVLDFGAIGDGKTNDTAAIQKAIDACREQGGGRVLLPGGHTFRSGALVLCSNLELHLEMGAMLKASDNLADYLLFGGNASPKKKEIPTYVNCEYNGAPVHYFLYAKDCNNLAITGLGTIDGNEEIFYGDVFPWYISGHFYPRAPMLFIENTDHLTIRDVTLQRSAFWTVHLVGCRDVLIDGIRILNNLKLANCDGIDPDHCQNVRIANCHIVCADDCIVFKNTAAAMQYGPCENITVTNCTLTSTSAAIKFGSESEALFRNILVENCVISRSNRAISLQLRDKGSIKNVIFRGITIETRLFREEFWGKAEPIAITVLRRKENTAVGTVENILFEDIFCDSENGILLYAEAPGAIRAVNFKNVRLCLQEQTRHEKGIHDLRPNPFRDFTEQELCYLFLHNACDVRFDNCRFQADPAMAPLLHQSYHICNCEKLILP